MGRWRRRSRWRTIVRIAPEILELWLESARGRQLIGQRTEKEQRRDPARSSHVPAHEEACWNCLCLLVKTLRPLALVSSSF
ncbi:hypothetical protein HYQ46_003141 [Verticillium longisporum]|nr:hypothetical protein HYQ46_003141 [Verticillium longisporum]